MRPFRAGVLLALGLILGQTGAAQDISFRPPDQTNTINLQATQITTWQSGESRLYHLHGNVEITQQRFGATADDAILWVQSIEGQPGRSFRVITYLEGNAIIELARMGEAHTKTGARADRIVDDQWLGRLFTDDSIDAENTAVELVGPPPPIFQRARQKLESGIQTSTQTVQFNEQQPMLISPQTGAIQPAMTAPQRRRPADVINQRIESPSGNVFSTVSSPQASQGVQPTFGGTLPPTPQTTQNNTGISGPNADVSIGSRDSTVDPDVTIIPNPNNPNERTWLVSGGVRVVIDSPDVSNMSAFKGDKTDQIFVLADNVVGWETTLPGGGKHWELYLEGNVVFAKDRRVIYAEKMYYDANAHSGTILNADVLMPVQQYEGLVRMKADVIQQVDANNMSAYGAAMTSSRLGVPRYWLQSGNISLSKSSVFQTDTRGSTLFDPGTGQPQSEDQYFAESRVNRVYVAGVPVFAWPRFRTNLNDPSLYLERFRIGSDSIFGTQIMTGWDMYQVLGFRRPPQGTQWVGIVDYLSDRGLGLGSEFEYERDSFLGIPGMVTGQYKGWFIDDDGVDFLGRGRANLVPEKNYRGRVIFDHRHDLGPGQTFRAELGYISDRNFLESFYEREWDQNKDATTGIWLERNFGTQSFNLTADLQINDFFTTTSWLPRLDHFLIGQPLFLDRAVAFGHSHFGYGRLRVADTPINAAEAAVFDPLAWEADVDGIRAGTRQEIDFPQQIGPVKVIPYILGDTTYWQEDIGGDDLLRVYGQVGVRASVPFWKVDPTIQSVLWNVNGLAHKVNLDFDAFFADASQDLDQLPMYDSLDDDPQEQFRRRFAFNTFGILPGGDVPLRFDERYFALRSGLQSHVTSPNPEIADDLSVVKMGVRQRWQTKRGLPGEERIIDWITLDLETTLFPDANRDNFGSDFGMFNYDFSWHIGDRLSIVSDGHFDFFSQGLRTASVGLNASRPELGNLYLGYRMIEGPISSNVISASLVYRMSEKWGFKGLTQVDFGDTGTIGQGLSFIYIGESFLWQFGLNYDASRDNLGFRFNFEPRFLRKGRLFNPGGNPVGPAGARWLE